MSRLLCHSKNETFKHKYETKPKPAWPISALCTHELLQNKTKTELNKTPVKNKDLLLINWECSTCHDGVKDVEHVWGQIIKVHSRRVNLRMSVFLQFYSYIEPVCKYFMEKDLYTRQSPPVPLGQRIWFDLRQNKSQLAFKLPWWQMVKWYRTLDFTRCYKIANRTS